MHDILIAPNMLPSLVNLALILIATVAALAGWLQARWVGRKQVDAADQAAKIAEAQRQQAEDQAETARILAKMAEDQSAAKLAQERMAAATAQLARDTATTALAQEKIAEDTRRNSAENAVIGVKVDGHLTELNTIIASLRSDLKASQQTVETGKEMASALAIQSVRDKAEADAKLSAAQQAPAVPLVVANGGGTQTVTIPGEKQVIVPEMILPVEDVKTPEAPKIITP